MMDGKADAPAIGIDLGTTYSCVAVWQHGKVHIIPNDQGNRTMPSCVSFTDGGRLIGEAAKNHMPLNPANTIYDAKRLIGRRFNDYNLQEDMKLWPFKVIKGINDIPKIVVEYHGEKKQFYAEEISSMVLMKLKEVAEAYLGETVRDAVITVPAYFDDSQREATKDAGHVAGLNVLQIINEPTSAAIAYGLDMRNRLNGDTNVLVFDLGGGTFDVSLVTLDSKGNLIVKAVAGDTHLGGQDFDNTMVDHFVKQFNRKNNTDMSGNIKALGRVRVACEKAKKILSSTTETTIELDALHQGLDFSMRITRAKFEHLNGDFFSKCIQLVENCLDDAKMNKRDVDEVVLVGGSTRIPKVQQMLKDLFNGKELCKKIHADEAVAYGAAVLAAKLTSERCHQVKNLVLLDVVPLSLGVRVHDGTFRPIIKRNTQIPARREAYFVTSSDSQSHIVFNVYQGERNRAEDNNWLGEFEVAVPLGPKGTSKVKVVFDIDVNGILNCSCKEVTTGLEKNIIIGKDKQRLSKEQIEKMLKEAEKYKHDDEEYKKKVFAHNALQEYIYDVKSKIKSIEGNSKTRIYNQDIEKLENVMALMEDASQILDESGHVDVETYEKTLNQLETLCVPIIARLV